MERPDGQSHAAALGLGRKKMQKTSDPSSPFGNPTPVSLTENWSRPSFSSDFTVSSPAGIHHGFDGVQHEVHETPAAAAHGLP